MNMKKLFCLILILCLAFTFSGCVNENGITQFSETVKERRQSETQSTRIERSEPMNKPTEVSLTDESTPKAQQGAPLVLTGAVGAAFRMKPLCGHFAVICPAKESVFCRSRP